MVAGHNGRQCFPCADLVRERPMARRSSDSCSARVTWAFDPAGRTVLMGDGTGLTDYAYDPAGRQTEVALPLGLRLTYDNDPLAPARQRCRTCGRALARPGAIGHTRLTASGAAACGSVGAGDGASARPRAHAAPGLLHDGRRRRGAARRGHEAPPSPAASAALPRCRRWPDYPAATAYGGRTYQAPGGPARFRR